MRIDPVNERPSVNGWSAEAKLLDAAKKSPRSKLTIRGVDRFVLSLSHFSSEA